MNSNRLKILKFRDRNAMIRRGSDAAAGRACVNYNMQLWWSCVLVLDGGYEAPHRLQLQRGRRRGPGRAHRAGAGDRDEASRFHFNFSTYQ